MELSEITFWAKTTADGKPGVDVFHHMLNVGYVALEIVKQYPKLLRRFGLTEQQAAVMAALHDIGKISPGFQQKCEQWLINNGLLEKAKSENWKAGFQTNHAIISQYTLERLLSKVGIERYCANLWAACIGAHHGTLTYNGETGIQQEAGMREDEWEDIREKTAQEIVKEFRVFPNLAIETGDPRLWWLAGLTTVSDWIGSDNTYFPVDINLDKKMISEKAARAIATIGLSLPDIKKNIDFRKVFGFEANTLQKAALNSINVPGIYVIEAPMGMGKTEAALAAAYQLLESGQAEGIYFALPTQVTSNRIHLRVKDFIDKICEDNRAVKLVHGNSWLVEANLPMPEVLPTLDQEKEIDWFASSKRALLSSFGVGTIDQALMGVIAVKHFFVRQYSLAGKVVILDEVHSYDMYTGTLINQLCENLVKLGATVIILSATLTASRRKELTGNKEDQQISSYPLISGKTFEGNPLSPVQTQSPEDKNVSVSFVQENKALKEICRKAENGANILWICDTVSKSQEIFEFFKLKAGSKIEIGLLHSRLPFFRREELENHWLDKLGKQNKNRTGCILVSTQVVEQSVDIDADLIVTELAPTDMLLQRIGRLWRHMSEHPKESRPVPEPEVWIIQEGFKLEETSRMNASEIIKGFGSKAYVYDPYVLLRTMAEWQTLKDSKITIPSGIRTILEGTYCERDNEPEGWLELKNKMLEHRQSLAQKALINTNVWMLPDQIDEEEKAMTRINSQPSVTVVLAREKNDNTVLLMDTISEIPKKEKKQSKKDIETARKIHKNLVKVPAWIFENKPMMAYLPKYVSGCVTLAVPGENGFLDIEGLKEGYQLKWSLDKGLEIVKPKEAMDESGE